MKLIYCTECGDIFSLGYDRFKCHCGRSEGQYVDTVNAEVSGPCLVLGIVNSSFKEAIVKYLENPNPNDRWGINFEAFIIPDNANSVKRIE